MGSASGFLFASIRPRAPSLDPAVLPEPLDLAACSSTAERNGCTPPFGHNSPTVVVGSGLCQEADEEGLEQLSNCLPRPIVIHRIRLRRRGRNR